MTRYQAWYRKREWARTWHQWGSGQADAFDARAAAAHSLTYVGTVEAIVVPDGVDPNDYTVTTIPGVVWRARASWPTDKER